MPVFTAAATARCSHRRATGTKRRDVAYELNISTCPLLPAVQAEWRHLQEQRQEFGDKLPLQLQWENADPYSRCNVITELPHKLG